MNRHERRKAKAQGRHEDKETARRLVEEDARRAGRGLRELAAKEGLATDVLAFDDPMPDDDNGGEGLFVNLTIGMRDDLSYEHAKAAAQKWLAIREKYPWATVYVHLLGYDQDPRELPHTPAVAAYICQWAKLAGIKDFDDMALGPLGLHGAALLGACAYSAKKCAARSRCRPVRPNISRWRRW